MINLGCPGAFVYVYDLITCCYVVAFVVEFFRPHCNFSFEIIKFTLSLSNYALKIKNGCIHRTQVSFPCTHK